MLSRTASGDASARIATRRDGRLRVFVRAIFFLERRYSSSRMLSLSARATAAHSLPEEALAALISALRCMRSRRSPSATLSGAVPDPSVLRRCSSDSVGRVSASADSQAGQASSAGSFGSLFPCASASETLCEAATTLKTARTHLLDADAGGNLRVHAPGFLRASAVVWPQNSRQRIGCASSCSASRLSSSSARLQGQRPWQPLRWRRAANAAQGGGR